MLIKTIHSNEPEYTSFIRKHASVYNTEEWISLYGTKCKVMGVFENDILVAVFNTYQFKKAVLEFFIPPPFMPDCALLISDRVNRASVVSAIKDWIEKKTAKKTYSLFRFNVSYKYAEDFSDLKVKGFSSRWNHTYVLDISKAEDVQSLYAPKRRQQIRRAIKDGLTTERITDLSIVFDLVKKTFDRQGKSIDLAFVKKILFEYANNKNSYAFASVLNKQYCVVYFCVHHNKEAYYLLGGYDESIKHIGAGPLAMNACIEHAKKIHIDTFDFEGSMEPNIEKYFKEFGGTKKLYPCYERSSKMGDIAVKLKKLIKG